MLTDPETALVSCRNATRARACRSSSADHRSIAVAMLGSACLRRKSTSAADKVALQELLQMQSQAR
ncbi:hypothetical protein I547_7753 [Mycobacterium kansasii 824]|nr:hypothetical protein I547_7753 [Mycobacterium kansasii 824]